MWPSPTARRGLKALVEAVGCSEIRPLHAGDAASALAALARLAGAGHPASLDGLITVPVPGEEMVAAAARSLEEAGIPVRHLAVRVPSLDEAFLAITGHHPAPGDTPGSDAQTMAGATR